MRLFRWMRCLVFGHDTDFRSLLVTTHFIEPNGGTYRLCRRCTKLDRSKRL
jgi:hypothetical protein